MQDIKQQLQKILEYYGEESTNQSDKFVVGEIFLSKKELENKLEQLISLAVEQEKERIVDLLPIEKMHTLADDVNSPHETEHDRGWNEYRRTLLTLINNK